MKDSLANEFEINLGDLRYFLGVEVAKSKNKILLSHTRPNITFAVGIVNQYMHAPNEKHMNAVVRLLRYLKGALKNSYFQKPANLEVEAYTDAN